MRTEEEILKDFSKLGWEVVDRNKDHLTLFNLRKDTRIFMYFKSKRLSFHDKVDLKVFRLVVELTKCWGWLDEEED